MKIKLYILIFIPFIFLVQKVFTSFSITEIYPNTNEDTTEEYVQITYDWNGNNNLSWYILSDKTWKEYIFENDIYINWENKKYFRPQTKILLNNSDEEIYLKNSSWELVDSFSYNTTELWKIYINEKIKNEIIDEIVQKPNLEENSSTEVIEEIENSTWTIIENEDSDNIEIETSTWFVDEIVESNSWSTQENSTENITNDPEILNEEIIEEKISFVIKNTFQTPTYLTDKDRELEDARVYNCDRTKDDCRVNFDFSNTFSASTKENDFNCIIDFWLWWATWEENKCNPNTVIFPIWTHNLNIKIINKTNSNNYFEINFKIINDWKIVSNTSSNNTNKTYEIINKPNKLNLKTPIIEVQWWLAKDNTCDKKECSINFIYEPIFDDINCLWNFWSGTFDSNTDKKCNPSYVIFPSWKHTITLEICDKNYESNCKKSEYIFENKYKYLEPKSIITLQWKLSKNKILDNDKITCIWVEKCSINFTWQESIWNELSYFWDFWDSDFFEWKNPSSHVFENWTYDVVLQVSDNNWWFSESVFSVEVRPKEESLLSAKEIEIEEIETNLSSIEPKSIISLKIDLQWKLWLNKKISWDTLTCIKTCSVNLDWSKSVWDFESYFWDFWNGETYVWKNPPYINYKDFWKYTVLFSLEDKEWNIYEKEFFINYIKEEQKKEVQKEIQKENILEYDYSNEVEIKQEEDIKKSGIEVYDEEIPISKPIIWFIILLSLIWTFFLFKKYKII